MIVEFFGPAGAGKTKLACALAERLSESGYDVKLAASNRPDEAVLVAGRPGQNSVRKGIILRLQRPLREIGTIVRHPLANLSQFRIAAEVMAALRPKSVSSILKRGQYIVRLAHSWSDALRYEGVFIFDQGFVQTVCSLALVSGQKSEELIVNALQSSPHSDLVVRLTAPEPCLIARLAQRRKRQGLFERTLELDMNRIVGNIDVFDRVHDALLKQNQRVRCGVAGSEFVRCGYQRDRNRNRRGPR